MSQPIFMSPEHVASMNAILAGDEASKAACGALEREYLLTYELEHRSGTVYWTMHFDPGYGVRFSLAPPAREPDVVFRGDYVESIRASAAAKAGRNVDMPWQMDGDQSAFEAIAEAFAVARRAATLDTQMPDV